MITQELSYRELHQYYSEATPCFSAILAARAAQESDGCYRCGRPLYYQPKKSRATAYECVHCKYMVYPLWQTPFHRLSPVELVQCFQIALDKIAHPSGYSAHSTAQLDQWRYATTWRMVHRVRKLMALANAKIKLVSPVQIDEVAINTGTKGLGRFAKRKRGFGNDTHTTVFGLMDSVGHVKLLIVENREEETLLNIVLDYVETGATIYSDEFRSYRKLSTLGYKHLTVNHSKGEYKKGEACTNRIEGFFGLMKSNLKGTYRQISETYCQNYLDEHAFRYNFRSLSVAGRLQQLLASLPPLFESVRHKKIV